MHIFLKFILILLASIIALFPTHVLLNRFLLLFKIRLSPHVGVLFAILAGNIITQSFLWKFVLLNTLSQTSFVIWAFIYSIIVYNSFGFLYFFFLTTTETSIHYHIITEVFLAGKDLTEEKFNQKYNDNTMMNVRLERLIDMGQVQEINGKYYDKGGFFLLVIKSVELWRAFLGIK